MNKYRIAEVFTSPQGEGLYTGTAMTFIRFAGCSVGRIIPEKKDVPRISSFVRQTEYGPLPLWQEECTTFDGRKFLCDTNFRKSADYELQELLDIVEREQVQHVCLTGGEPLIHDIKPLLDALEERSLVTHIETSGTISLAKVLNSTWEQIAELYDAWITISPKFPLLEEMVDNCDEIKVLVDDKFQFSAITEKMLAHPLLYLQPINNVLTVDKANLKRCLDFQRDHPHVRISSQLHKIWGVR